MSGTNAGLSISQLPTASTANLGDELAATQGSSGPGTGTTRKITPAQILALATPILWNQARLQLQWANGAILANGLVQFVWNAPYAGTVESLDAYSGTGTFTGAVAIEGVAVTGLSAVAVTSTPTNTAATGANTFSAGQSISLTVSAATGSPTNALAALRVVWATPS